MQLSREQMLQAYRRMKIIREFEERLHIDIATGAIAGFTHLYCGQEAVAVGSASISIPRTRSSRPTAATATAWPRAAMSTG